MTQHVKAPTTKPAGLGTVPRTSMVEIREPTPSSVLCPVHTCCGMCVPMYTQIDIHKQRK